jgi:4-amino-4-deoxy-L-arabinose transferase-like glycosyltransferase
MDRTAEDRRRRRRFLIGLQILRFIIAAVLIGIAIYFRDPLLVILAIAFVGVGIITTRLRLKAEEADELPN